RYRLGVTALFQEPVGLRRHFGGDRLRTHLLPVPRPRAGQTHNHGEEQPCCCPRVLPPPLPQPLPRPRPPRLDRLVRHEPPQILRQLLRRRVPLPRLLPQRLQDDRLQVRRDPRRQTPRRRRLLERDLPQDLLPVRTVHYRPQRQQLVERRPQGV